MTRAAIAALGCLAAATACGASGSEAIAGADPAGSDFAGRDGDGGEAGAVASGDGTTGRGTTDDGTPRREASAGTSQSSDDEDDGVPVAEPVPEPRFVDVTVAAGLDVAPAGVFAPPSCLLDDMTKPDSIGDYCFPERFLGAAAVGDVDGDGWQDVLVTQRGGPARLYHNDGAGGFVDIANAAGLSFAHPVGAAAWADVDNDGDLDLMLTGVGTTRHFLLVNDGHAHFSEQAVTRGAAVLTDDVHVGMGIGVGDFDLDGWLDLFVAEWHPAGPLGAADHNRLLRGVGAGAPGSFQDVSTWLPLDLARLANVVDAKAGVYGFSPAFADLDDDGWPELTLTADFGTSRLLWNNAGRFVDGTWASGVGTERNGMGSTFGDFDRDGDIDWFVAAIWSDDFPTLGHRLYENLGDRTFSDVAPAHGVHDAGWGWGASWLDYDLDGDLDLAMAAGWPGLGYNDDRLRLWENTGPGAWPERSASLGIDVVGDGRGLVALDYDNDGDLDLLVVGNAQGPRLFRNDVADQDWLVVRAVGSVSNRQGIGARVAVWVDPDAEPRIEFIRGDTQLMGQPAAEARLGLGACRGQTVAVEVTFPASGSVQRVPAARCNSVVVVPE